MAESSISIQVMISDDTTNLGMEFIQIDLSGHKCIQAVDVGSQQPIYPPLLQWFAASVANMVTSFTGLSII